MKTPLAILILAFGLGFWSHAQNYATSLFTIDGGGGTSTGGMYSLSGTIGQPDAGKRSGGTYALDGGYWSVLQTPGAPPLSITRTGAVVTVFWPRTAEGFILDQTSALASLPATIAWSQVPFPYQTNANRISISASMPGGNRIYRLRKP